MFLGPAMLRNLQTNEDNSGVRRMIRILSPDMPDVSTMFTLGGRSQPVDHGWGFSAMGGMWAFAVIEFDPFSHTGLRL